MTEEDKQKIIEFLYRKNSYESIGEYSSWFDDYSREDYIRTLATEVWDNSHGEASNLAKLISDLKIDLPEYFAETMQAALSGNHDT